MNVNNLYCLFLFDTEIRAKKWDADKINVKVQNEMSIYRFSGYLPANIAFLIFVVDRIYIIYINFNRNLFAIYLSYYNLA